MTPTKGNDNSALETESGDPGELSPGEDEPLWTMRKDRLNGLHTRLANLVAALQHLNRGQADDPRG